MSFEPIFIVGNNRSGTTLLATLLDRHSRIAVPPETHFLGHFADRLDRPLRPIRHEDLVDDLSTNHRLRDLNLDWHRLLFRFKEYPADLPHLFRATLEVYTASCGKQRAGEKTPGHLRYVPVILEWFPQARIVCIVRDGRAVVSSLLKLGWGKGDIVGLCLKWRQNVRRALAFEKRYAGRFMRVQYEELVQEPRRILTAVDEFVGIHFEESQLEPSGSTHVVPTWEAAWKAKAGAELDPTRIGAWRRELTEEQLWLMNLLFGKYLRLLNYPDADLSQRLSPQLITFAAGRFADAARRHVTAARQLRRIR